MAVSQDNAVTFCDINTGQELGTLKGNTQSVETLAFSPQGAHLASASDVTGLKL